MRNRFFCPAHGGLHLWLPHPIFLRTSARRYEVVAWQENTDRFYRTRNRLYRRDHALPYEGVHEPWITSYLDGYLLNFQSNFQSTTGRMLLWNTTERLQLVRDVPEATLLKEFLTHENAKDTEIINDYLLAAAKHVIKRGDDY